MPADDLFEKRGERAVELSLHVQPGAGRSAVVGRHGTALKVRVAAPPVGGRANSACIDLLAETFGVRSDQVDLTSGETSRSKRFRINDVDVDEFRRQLEQAVEPAGVPARPPSQVGRIRP
ncbi:MAG: DUF167 domain-containing protein [Acidimicrobiales bacterium]